VSQYQNGFKWSKRQRVAAASAGLGYMQVCNSLQADNHASTPPLSFLLVGCPSSHPTNSIKALNARIIKHYTHARTRLTALCPGLPRWAGTRKAKPIWILLKQETVSSSGISWAICKSAPRSTQITTPAPHHSNFLQAGCPSLPPNQQRQSTEGKTIHTHALLYSWHQN